MEDMMDGRKEEERDGRPEEGRTRGKVKSKLLVVNPPLTSPLPSHFS
jgi:hypothetical protein